MSKLEMESKFEVTTQTFERFQAAFIVKHCQQQLNVYYDSNWRLAEQAATLRIRYFKAHPPVLTLKVPVGTVRGKRLMKEYELVLERERHFCSRSSHPTWLDVERDLPHEAADALLNLGVQRLARVGWMRNTRFIISLGEGCVELDRTQLPDGSEVYEIEVEAEDHSEHERLVNRVLETIPDARPSKVSKFQRFRAAAAALGGHGRG